MAPDDRATGVIRDQTIAFNGHYATSNYPEHLRRTRYKAPDTGKLLVHLTNRSTLPCPTDAALHKSRWRVELLFKQIEQHLRSKRFHGTSENAVKTQIWIAALVYVLVAIVKKELHLKPALHILLQFL